jgi:hypothetical protein
MGNPIIAIIKIGLLNCLSISRIFKINVQRKVPEMAK